MKQALCLIFSIFISLTPATLYAEVRIEITRGSDSARPICVLPFQLVGIRTLPEDISNIISSDLRNSGKFSLIDSAILSQKPVNIQEIRPDVWITLGINTIIMGRVTSSSNNYYHVTYQLVSVDKSKGITLIIQNSLKAKDKSLRLISHKISDEVFEKLTGIKGAFQTRIAYIVKTNDGQFAYELRVSDYDGYNQFIIHRSLQPLMSPAWSPDGSKLAYVTFESGRSALVMQDLSNNAVRLVSSLPCHNGAPAFSPDGTKLAFALSKTGNLNLYIMDITSGRIHQITNDRSNNTEPAWFPDSQNLAFTSDQSGRPQVYKTNIYDNRAPQRITWKGLQNQNAVISADGKIMVMVSISDNQQHISKQDLITGDVQVLSSSFLDETPSLAPNDVMVIYSSSQGMGSVLNLVSIDGNFAVSLPATDGQAKSPTWSPYL